MQSIGSFAISMPYLFSIVPCAQTVGDPFAKIEAYGRSLPPCWSLPRSHPFAHIRLLHSSLAGRCVRLRHLPPLPPSLALPITMLAIAPMGSSPWFDLEKREAHVDTHARARRMGWYLRLFGDGVVWHLERIYFSRMTLNQTISYRTCGTRWFK
jgi:hypothetical protein